MVTRTRLNVTLCLHCLLYSYFERFNYLSLTKIRITSLLILVLTHDYMLTRRNPKLSISLRVHPSKSKPQVMLSPKNKAQASFHVTQASCWLVRCRKVTCLFFDDQHSHVRPHPRLEVLAWDAVLFARVLQTLNPVRRLAQHLSAW
jgi:hypothetical protein